MQIAVIPTVFIGLGGTGQLVLNRLRARLCHRVGTPDLPFFRFVYVDTHRDAVSEAVRGLTGNSALWSTANVISPSAETIRCVQDPNRDNYVVAEAMEIDSWLDQFVRTQLNPAGYSQGVGGRRMFSRLGFLGSQNLATLEQTLLQYYNQLITSAREHSGRVLEGIEPPYLNVTPHVAEGDVRFVVVASSGGGTGSGSFVDLGYLLKKLKQEHRWGDVMRQFGIVALSRPGLETEQQQRNTAALLTELDFYGDPTTRYSAGYLTLTKTPRYEDTDPPYDITYLVSATQGSVPLAGQSAPAFDELLWKMAEYLVNDAVAAYDDVSNGVPPTEVKPVRSGVVGQIGFLGDVGLNPKGLQTLGVSAREWPAALIHRRLYALALGKVTQTWVEPQMARCEGLEGSLRELLGVPGESVQKNGDPRPLTDKLLERLLKSRNNLDPRTQLTNQRELAYDEKRRVTDDRLLQCMNSLRQQFVSRAGEPTSANEPGVVTSIVRNNLEELLGIRKADSLAQQVAAHLLALALDAGGGPASALHVTQRVLAAVQAEQVFVQQALDGLEVAPPEKPRTLEQCYGYANGALLQLVLGGKKTLYLELIPWLQRLELRFRHFTGYVRSWAQGAQAGSVEIPTDVPAIVAPAGVVQRLEQALEQGISVDMRGLEGPRKDQYGAEQPGLATELRGVITAGLPDKDDANRPALFSDGPPTIQGEPDYSYLHALESAIFESIGRSPASPYREQVLTLVLEQAKVAKRPFPSLLSEAELLVNYDVAHPAYARQSFNGNATHLTRVARSQQGAFRNFLDAQTPGRGWLDQWQAVGGLKEVDAQEQAGALNAYTVAYVAERCAIQTQFLSGYDFQQRRTLFDRDKFTAFSDKRVELAPDPALYRKAMGLFLGSIMLKLWKYLGQSQPFHEFQYEVQDRQSGFQRSRTYHASDNVEDAARKLAANTEVRDALHVWVRQHVEPQRGVALADLQEAYQRINGLTQGSSTALSGDLPWCNLRKVHFETALDCLHDFAREFDIPLPAPDHPYAEFVDLGTIRANGERAHQDGWHCKRCGYTFGANMPPRSGTDARCRVCSNPFADSRPRNS